MATEMEKEQKLERQRTWVNQMVAAAQKKQWYGTIEIVLQAGVVRHVHKKQSLIPPS